jgi:hypothetical protein
MMDDFEHIEMEWPKGDHAYRKEMEKRFAAAKDTKS